MSGLFSVGLSVVVGVLLVAGAHALVLRGFGNEPALVPDALLGDLRDIEHARGKRLTPAEGRMPGVVWVMVVTTAFIVLLFSALAHAGNRAARPATSWGCCWPLCWASTCSRWP